MLSHQILKLVAIRVWISFILGSNLSAYAWACREHWQKALEWWAISIFTYEYIPLLTHLSARRLSSECIYNIVSAVQLMLQASYLCFLYLALCEIPEFRQPFAKSRLQGFPFTGGSFYASYAITLDNIDGVAIIEYRKQPFVHSLRI